MPMCVVYVGDIGDPDFRWEGGDWNGNIPRRLSTDFPPTHTPHGGYGAWSEVVHRIETGVYPGRQVDWGAWVAKVLKAEIVALLSELYDEDEDFRPGTLFTHFPAWLDQLRLEVAALDSSTTYGLVAAEMS